MEIMREIQKKFGHIKVISGAVQDEVTSAIIRSITDVQREQGSAEALKIAQLFNKAIALYDEGVPLATALLAAAEINKDKKSAAKILGFSAICVASILPYVLINQEDFQDFIDELSTDAKNEAGRKLRNGSNKVTRLKIRKKA